PPCSLPQGATSSKRGVRDPGEVVSDGLAFSHHLPDLQIAVRTFLPFQLTFRGRPTLTDSSVPTTTFCAVQAIHVQHAQALNMVISPAARSDAAQTRSMLNQPRRRMRTPTTW